MKQRITIEQLNELSEEKKRKLPTKWIHQDHDRDSDSWCYSCRESVSPEDKAQYEPALLSIGQMIEFLDERNSMPYSLLKKSEWHGGGFDVLFAREQLRELTETAMTKNMILKQASSLCNALWEAIKEVLNGNKS